jgi:SAM-dependent methyltransferase
LNKYAILRRNGWRTPEDLEAAAMRSKQVGDEQMPDDVRWVRSYVLIEEDGSLGTVCIYLATDTEAVRGHAVAADLPVDEIRPVADTVVIRPDPNSRRPRPSKEKETPHMSTTNHPATPAINANKALWEKGDFTRIAASMRESGEALVATLGITDGLRVLDLGCGDGTTALPAARLGADVLGVDIASNLVAAGNVRARSQGLTNLRFQEGDASDLSEIDDDSFDLVVSIFGAMFAPRPADVAKEVVRVTRPGGRIVMGNWIPNDPTLVAQILKISSSYSPPPPEGFVSPMTWGVEDNVIERFTGAGVPEANISFARDTYTFNFPGTPSELLDEFRTYYGPTMNAYEAAAADGRETELHAELDALFNEQNASSSDDVTSIPATFLRVTVAV